MIFALGAPHRGQIKPDPDRFAITRSPYVPLDSTKALMDTRRTIAVVISLFSIGVSAPFAQPHRIVLSANAVVDGRGRVLGSSRIVIEGSKIVTIDSSTGPVDYDLGRATVMLGWIDTHVHLNWHFDEHGKSSSGGTLSEANALYTAEDAWVTLRGGFTTVQSLGSAVDGPVRDRIARGDLPGPRVLTSLRQIQNRSGDDDALRALVRRTKEEGADVIKLFA